jgi:hypothetical protein
MGNGMTTARDVIAANVDRGDDPYEVADNVIAALLAAPDLEPHPDLAAKLNPWRDIGTAPNDGTFVLCYLPSGHRVILQFCADNYWRRNVESGVVYHPTRWLPLPAPPSKDKAK